MWHTMLPINLVVYSSAAQMSRAFSNLAITSNDIASVSIVHNNLSSHVLATLKTKCFVMPVNIMWHTA